MSVGYPSLYQLLYGQAEGFISMSDLLTLADGIELLGGGVPSGDPRCPGAVFRLASPFDFGAPPPDTDMAARMILDGERKSGHRTGMVLPVTIMAPTRLILDAAREVLMQAVAADQWTLRYVRNPEPGTPPLPLIFDCQSADTVVVAHSIIRHQALVSDLTLTFQAAPYGRSDVPQVIDFPSPIAGRFAPPSPLTIDDFSTVSQASWSQSLIGPGPHSAHWAPGSGSPTGAGQVASYARTGMTPADLAAGWALVSQGNAVDNHTITLFDAQPWGSRVVSLNDQFQLALNALTGDNAGFEGGTTGNWGSRANSTVANSAAQAHGGTHSMLTSSVAAGDMSQTLTVATVPWMACQPGDMVFASGWSRAVASPRQVQIGVLFADAFFNPIAVQSGAVIFGAASIPNTTTGWVQPVTQQIAPAGTAWALPVTQVLATGAAAEGHYWDDIYIGGRGSVPAQAQVFTVTSLDPPGVGYAGVHFTPNAAANVVQGEVMIQAGPPQRSAMSFYAGFGSTRYFTHWGKAGGPVRFALTLTDGTSTIKWARTIKVRGGSNAATPVWTHVSMPVPYVPGFNYRTVTGYTLTISNRGTGDLVYTEAYIDSLSAVPAPVAPGPAPVRGTLVRFHGLPGTARAPASWQFQQTGATVLATRTFTTPGTFSWLAPYGVTSVATAKAIGPGGRGGITAFGSTAPGGGGGGGEEAEETNVAVTPLTAYLITVGAGDGTVPSTTFAGDSLTLTAHKGGDGGNGISTTGGAAGAAGTGSVNSVHRNGGAGSAGVNGGSPGAGGSSAGTAAAGNPGVGAVGGAAVTGGGKGGDAALAGHAPGGGGGGQLRQASPQGPNYLHGGDGWLQLTYYQPPPMTNLIVHRPGFDAPDTLCPFVPVPVTDLPDGNTEYTVPVLIPGLPARFDGTYTMIAVNYTWSSPGNSRTLFATVKQYEQAGGNSVVSSTPVKTFVPSTDPDVSPNGIVVLGEITLPVRKLAADNPSALFTLTLTDSNTADRFMDILLLDTMGQTTIINGTAGYANFGIDEPSDSDISLIWGSAGDRDAAVSVTDTCLQIQPPAVDPEGNQLLLAYSTAGAPAVYETHYPRWRQGRVM